MLESLSADQELMISSVHGVALPILPGELWVQNSFNAGGLNRRGQPWRTFLVSDCLFLSIHGHPCRILPNFDANVYLGKLLSKKCIKCKMYKTPCVETILYPELSQ